MQFHDLTGFRRSRSGPPAKIRNIVSPSSRWLRNVMVAGTFFPVMMAYSLLVVK
jgi:hypothetical protein